MLIDELATRHLFFTGKGGVGKTSISCATAVALAERGKRVLIVSTDPASNLDQVLATPLSPRPTAIAEAPGLFAANLDPEAAAREYRERVVAPYRGILPQAALSSIEEQLSGACTVEIAAFDEFAKLLGDAEASRNFDHIVFDTAPTGHTLRLLKLPAAWSDFIQASTGGTSCLGPLAGLQAQHALYRATVETLADARRTTVVLVSRPDHAALAEAERTRGELAEIGITNLRLALNAVFAANDPQDPIARALEARGRKAVAAMPAGLAALPRSELGLMAGAPLGVPALRALLGGGQAPSRHKEAQPARDPLPPPLVSLVEQLAASGRGVVMTMGKGGVGKTTVAAAIATELARRGHRVLLTTTDPAAHVASAVGTPVPGLRLSRIDPAQETRRYAEETLARAGRDLDTQGLALLEEDLKSPCTEEVAVFRAFAQTVAEGGEGFVILDTAPTGHTILLLDAAESYHREVAKAGSELPEAVRNLLPRLRDPSYTRVLITTLAEATPVQEAERLQADLRRAGIEPFAWVINQSFLASGTADPLLLERGRCEAPFVERVQRELATRCALVPWLAEAPTGEGLAGLMRAA